MKAKELAEFLLTIPDVEIMTVKPFGDFDWDTYEPLEMEDIVGKVENGKLLL